MISTSLHLSSSRVRRLGLGLLLLAVPACGLSDYEKLMRDTQEREERFREEQKYLDQPVQMPETEKDGKKVPVANVFFRPPKGIEPKPQQRNDLMWQYRAGSGGSDFSAVELAFADDDKDFAHKVMNSYESSGQAANSTRQFTVPGQQTPMVFDVWEFSNGQVGVSINILRGSSKPVAIVYISKGRLDSARKAIDLSLQSLGVDQKVGAARQRYNQKSPWKLQAQPGS